MRESSGTVPDGQGMIHASETTIPHVFDVRTALSTYRGEAMQLVITGWKPGVKAVSLIDALRKYGGMGLKQAKQAVDALLAGKPIHISLHGEVLPDARAELEALGCICR